MTKRTAWPLRHPPDLLAELHQLDGEAVTEPRPAERALFEQLTPSERTAAVAALVRSWHLNPPKTVAEAQRMLDQVAAHMAELQNPHEQP